MYNLVDAKFGDVPLDGWFKRTKEGPFQLKTTDSTAAYNQWSSRFETSFAEDEPVLVELLKAELEPEAAL